MKPKISLYLIVFFTILACFCFALSQGSLHLSLYQLLFTQDPQLQNILNLRFVRALSAFTSGGLLALAGTLMQLLLNNPLADPYVLGISSGAALTTLLLMLYGYSGFCLVAGSWLGSLGTIFLIMLLARRHQFLPHSLLLCGIALACGFSACISLILVLSPDTQLHNMLFWLTGDLNDATLPWVSLSILALGFVSTCLLARGFNIFSRGQTEARSLGLASHHYRLSLYLLASFCTAGAVSLAGCIGFVGLIIPHITRRLVGYDHRHVIPLSVLLGGNLVLIADTLARTIFAPQQLPVGIVLAMIGVPIFIGLLNRAQY